MARLFGTDGIRGVANREPITSATALRVGAALGRILLQGGGRGSVVVGSDTRVSGPMLEGALVAGLCSAGVDVELAGVLPTPGVAWLTRTMGAKAGVVVSASHNPFSDNGIKIFGGDGFKLTDEQENEIEAALSHPASDSAPIGEFVGRARSIDRAVDRYREFLAGTVPKSMRLNDSKIVVDCANGAAYEVGPQLLESLGAGVSVIGASPDGTNINAGCGAVHPETLRRQVLASGADLGIAVDGDADRVILVDDAGSLVDGDDILGLIALDRTKRDALPSKRVVATVMSNYGLELSLKAVGVDLIRTAVGDRYVVEEMRRQGLSLGGESSGHLIFLEHSTTGDGLLAALQVAELMVRSGQALSELRRAIHKLPQVLVNVRVAQRVDIDSLPAAQREIERVRRVLNDRGRVLVRSSGTEPVVRVMVEGEEAGEVERLAQALADTVRNAVEAMK